MVMIGELTKELFKKFDIANKRRTFVPTNFIRKGSAYFHRENPNLMVCIMNIIESNNDSAVVNVLHLDLANISIQKVQNMTFDRWQFTEIPKEKFDEATRLVLAGLRDYWKALPTSSNTFLGFD